MNKRGQEYVITMIVVLALMTLILGLYMGWIDTSIPVINSLIGKENLDLRVQECNNACNSIPPQSYAYCQKTRKLTLPDKKKTEGTCYEFSRGENIPAEYKSYFQSCEKINCEEFLGGVEAEEEDGGEDEEAESPLNPENLILKMNAYTLKSGESRVLDLNNNNLYKIIGSNSAAIPLATIILSKDINSCDYPPIKINAGTYSLLSMVYDLNNHQNVKYFIDDTIDNGKNPCVRLNQFTFKEWLI